MPDKGFLFYKLIVLLMSFGQFENKDKQGVMFIFMLQDEHLSRNRRYIFFSSYDELTFQSKAMCVFLRKYSLV